MTTLTGWGSLRAVENYVMHWREENGAALGEGLSRTSSPRAKLFEVVVVYKGERPMHEWLKACSKKEALKFASNRYPKAVQITVISNAKIKRAT